MLAAISVTTGITPFMDLMSQVMPLPEYRDAPRVSVIADNGSHHRGQAAIRRLRDAWPNAIMIHTPVHASWLNQAEIFFSITQKKVITPNDFASLDELAGTLLRFFDRDNQTARPLVLARKRDIHPAAAHHHRPEQTELHFRHHRPPIADVCPAPADDRIVRGLYRPRISLGRDNGDHGGNGR